VAAAKKIKMTIKVNRVISSGKSAILCRKLASQAKGRFSSDSFNGSPLAVLIGGFLSLF
jgi:hypothetical protein